MYRRAVWYKTAHFRDPDNLIYIASYPKEMQHYKISNMFYLLP